VILGKLAFQRKVVEGWLERDPKNSNKVRVDPTFLKSGDQHSEVEKVGQKKKRYSKTIIRLTKVFKKELFTNPSQQQFNYLSLVKAQLITGRRHQLRAHLSYLNYPILGDPLYGGKLNKKVGQRLRVGRLMLHAWQISFVDPSGNKKIEVNSDIPQEFERILKA
jgi:23S rRNA-/tRNA-specific pseudouridylate synthase